MRLACGLRPREMNLLTCPPGEHFCVEPIVSAELFYSAHRTMPMLPWTPHTG